MTNFKKDEMVTGTVTGVKPYGIFVSINQDYNGLIHISEMSSDFVRNVSDYAYVGEEIIAKVISVDQKNHQVKLSIKNVDYKKDNKSRIVETVHGFNTLKEKLPEWIEFKIKEFEDFK